jgi:site-specific recombinase XerD
MDTSLSPIIDQFIADVCAGKVNATPAAYRSKLSRLAHWMDANRCAPCELSAEDVTSFIHSMQNQSEKRVGSKTVKGHLSPFTVHTTLRTVKHFLHWSYARGHIPLDLSGFKIPPLPMPDPKAIDEKNVTALLLAAARLGEGWEQARNLAILYVLRDTGGRIGAILSADMDNLDLACGKLFVKEKGDKPLTLYLNPPAILALTEWLRVRPILHPRCHHLFISCRGFGLTRSGWYSVLNRLIDTADLRGHGRTNPHAFRHAFARDSLSAGEDLSKVSQTMGHSSVRVTADYYARWADGELQEAHRQFSPGAKLIIIRPKNSN